MRCINLLFDTDIGTLTTCHCPRQLQQSIDISWPPGPQQQTCSSGIRDRQTDGRTPVSCIDSAAYTTRAVTITLVYPRLIPANLHAVQTPRAWIVPSQLPGGANVHTLFTTWSHKPTRVCLSYAILIGSSVCALHSPLICPTHRHTDHGMCDVCSDRPHPSDACDAA